MAIGTPVGLGTNISGTAASSIAITPVTASAGAAILVLVTSNAAGTLSVTDTASNTYVGATVQVFSSPLRYQLFYCANPSALSAGTITASSSASARLAVAAVSVSGLTTSSPLDVTATPTTGTGTTTSVGPVTPSQAVELIVGMTIISGNQGTWTEASGFTGLNVPSPLSTDENIEWAYQIVASTSAVTYAPSWATSKVFGGIVYTFTGLVTDSAGAATGAASASGVGSALAASAGSAPATAVVSGLGASLSQAAGSAIGLATVSGVGASYAAAAGAAIAGAVALGVGAMQSSGTPLIAGLSFAIPAQTRGLTIAAVGRRGSPTR